MGKDNTWESGGSVLGCCRSPWAADLSTDYSDPGATTTTAHSDGFSGLRVCRATQGSQGQGSHVQSNPDMHPGPELGEANDRNRVSMDRSEKIDSKTGMRLSEDWSGVWPME